MTKTLKILAVLPLYGGSLPIGQFCVDALRDLGHKVEVFQAPDFYPALQAFNGMKVSLEKHDFLQNTFTQLLSEAIYAQAESFMPDLVFCLAQAPLTRQVLKRLEKDKIPTAMWFVEDYELFTYWRAYANLYTYFFVIQKEPFLSLLREGGHTNAHYLPLAALPCFHQKAELSQQEKLKYSADVAFLGAGYTNRRHEFKKLMRLPSFKIWGSDWEGENLLKPFIQDSGARISPEDCVKIYSATKINLNLHSSIHAEKTKKGDFVNPRTFELASIGAFQLVDRRTLMPELFEISGENRELVTFENFDEVPSLINHYTTKADEREQIAERARQRVLRDHTYQIRMEEMLKIINPQVKDNKDYEEYLKDIPETMRTEVADLLKELELPANADFDDILLALRKETKPLSPLETSILFLDEWRKQYGKKA